MEKLQQHHSHPKHHQVHQSNLTSRVLILKSNSACIENINVRSPASSGRFDVVLDFILECLFIDRRSRDDVKVMIVLSGCAKSRVLMVDGRSIPYFENEDDLLKYIIGGGVTVLDTDFEELIDSLIREGYKLYCLYEEGTDIENIYIRCSKVGFIIGDQDGFLQEDLRVMKSRNIEFVSIGPIPYLSWYCCVFINYYLDSRCRSR